MAKLKEILTLTIERLSHEGRGIAKYEGKTVFVTDALPGEQVVAKVCYQKKQLLEAETLEVLQASPERTTPICEVYGRCGGCSLQHMASSQQLVHKEAVLLEQLKHFGHVVPNVVAPPLQGPTAGYRHKARLGVRYVAKKGGVLVGFRERNGKFLMDMSHCPVLHPSIGEKITAWRALLASLAVKAEIPQIELAVAGEETAVVVRHLVPLPEEDLQKLIHFAQTHHYRLYGQIGGPDTMTLLWPKAAGDLQYRLPAFDITIALAPNDFTQVNHELNQKMIQQAIDWLDLQPHDRVLDLFSGLGNFTLPMARQCAYVLGVEGDQPMVNKAKYNAALNQVTNVDFHAANLFEPQAKALQFAEKQFTKVLLDPPRAGAETMMHELANLGVNHVVYVSCNPATFARDVGILVNHYGYRLDKVGIMDMFPHTAHTETMGLLRK